ncbi:amidohydrolase AmhX [Brevibacillus agri]|uniref:Amidohydrolase n=1 Tax=Brevibacillus agri TaxID=51101 RepID=A0A3M8BAX3_9BACL|nr:MULTISPECIES: M20 peptidase aminoacylase family protein [Brevibacillus]ELK41185.1 amidohydrolase amhX [Brevibacillus agri BAB-2500]EJL43615.1 amidohydrolase [Brevibacillus sp. CF112]MBG9565274.1 amidohydrolase [Brevibacillus agri]MBY0053744.1 M20 peptidase aminoacylase family protein [Brevibacillus agri]MCG5253189.1 M20 peptidase aminoacylase family protein [Brevibacillus agri]
MRTTIKQLQPAIFSLYEHLHRHPEVSWQEVETTAYIARFLQERHCRVTTFDDVTGVVAEWGDLTPGGLTVGVRADMDALWQEVNGVFQANHSCGHDAHMTMVLGVLMVLQAQNIQLPGRLKLIFQPAEESGNGALAMVKKQVVDDIDYLYGVHLRPVQEIPRGTAASAIMHGAAGTIFGQIKGDDAHGARPHLGVNAIEVAAAIVEQLKGIHLDPLVPYSVKMTQLSAGSKSSNIIPGSAQFHLDLRAQTNLVIDALFSRVEHILQHVAQLYEVDLSYDITERVYAAEVHEEARQIMAEAIVQTLGADRLEAPIQTPGAEDFHYYTKERPHLRATMLGLGCGLAPGLHHPQMTFDKEALLDGIEILARTVLTTFERHAGK